MLREQLQQAYAQRFALKRDYVRMLKYDPAQRRDEHTGQWVSMYGESGLDEEEPDSTNLEAKQVAHDTHVAIEQYVQGNASYLNGTLRAAGRKARGAWVERYKEYPVNQEQVDLFDEHMRKNVLTEDTVLYRTVPNYVVDELKVGDVYQDDGYVSTTRNVDLIPSIRQDIGARVSAYHSVMTVLAPKGLGHIDVNEELGKDHRYWHQKEIILPRGQRYQIVSKGPGNTMTVKVLQ